MRSCPHLSVSATHLPKPDFSLPEIIFHFLAGHGGVWFRSTSGYTRKLMMATNVPELRRQAEAGSCVARSVLGGCYLYGQDAEVDYKEAFRFLSAAANQGSSRAVLNLGRMYAQGLGVSQNVAEAIRLFESVGKPESSTDAIAARIELGRNLLSGRRGTCQ
jgi:hypothetical protein